MHWQMMKSRRNYSIIFLLIIYKIIHWVCFSSMSTGLNSMCGVIFEDLIRPAYNKPISERTASFIMKIIVVVIGLYILFLYKLLSKRNLNTLTRQLKLLRTNDYPYLTYRGLGMSYPCLAVHQYISYKSGSRKGHRIETRVQIKNRSLQPFLQIKIKTLYFQGLFAWC